MRARVGLKNLMHAVREQCMDLVEAESIISGLRSDSWLRPFQNRAALLRHVAAFVTVYTAECSRQVFGKKDHPGLNSLINICQLTQVNYLVNHLKFACTLTKDEYERFPTGTTGNEAIHNKLNSASRETTVRYQDTIASWLQVMRVRLQIYHETAATVACVFRQFSPQDLLCKAMSDIALFTNLKWDEYAK